MTDEKPNETETTLGGTPRPKMLHTQTAIARLAAIPPEKRQSKLVRTVIGALVCAFGWYAKAHWASIPDLVAFGTVAFGGVTVAGEYVTAPFKIFIGMLRDLLNVVRGKTADQPPAP